MNCCRRKECVSWKKKESLRVREGGGGKSLGVVSDISGGVPRRKPERSWRDKKLNEGEKNLKKRTHVRKGKGASVLSQ